MTALRSRISEAAFRAARHYSEGASQALVEEALADKERLEAELLAALWPTLKPGGRLVYATCSMFKAEGEAQIDAFLQRQPDAERLEVSGFTGHLLPLAHNEAPEGMALEAAQRAGAEAVFDGFFYALLHKRA